MKYSLCIALALIFSTVALAQLPEDSLLLHFTFDGNAMDQSGYGNHGTNYNALPDTDRAGNPTGAFRFNGVNSYVEVAASPSMNRIQTADVITISAWININRWHSSGNVFSLFERYNALTDAGWLLEANWAGGGIIFLADESNLDWAGCNFTWNFHQWYFLCLTYDKAQSFAHFYIDGSEICNVPYTAPINVSDTLAPFAIGRSLAGPDEYSDGLIDDLKIYNRVLQPAEIQGKFVTAVAGKTQYSELAVYPNPVNDLLTLKTGNDVGSFYRITDSAGKTVLKGFITEPSGLVDVSRFEAGIYFLLLENQSGYHPVKLVKL